MRTKVTAILLAAGMAAVATGAERKKKAPAVSPLDRYIQDALKTGGGAPQASSGSLWSPASRLTDLGSDLRASQVNDLVTILVSESASAVVQGATKTQRQSQAAASIPQFGGLRNPTGTLANLLNASSNTQLDGEGTTSRSTQLSTAMSARVTNVLPNGYLVIEGIKEVGVNAEHQVVTVRGVIRPADLSTSNTILSNQIAQMELQINGKGVVNDAVKRPFFLYRLLLGLLPF